MAKLYTNIQETAISNTKASEIVGYCKILQESCLD